MSKKEEAFLRMSLFAYVLTVVAFFAGVLKSGFGIGAGIFLTPMLALVTDPQEAVVLVAPMMLFTDIVAVYQYWRKWDLRDVFALGPPCLLGAMGGVFLLNWFTPDLARRAIGLIGLLYVGTEILKIGLRVSPTSQSLMRSLPIGLVAGVASALANSGGVFLSTYIAGRLRKEYFVGTLVLVFVLLNMTKVGMFTGLGLLNQKLWLIELRIIPLMFLGGLVGKGINRRIQEKHFMRWIFVLIVGACIKLLFF
jgi:uncharacterized membrane protein YfcA